MKNILIDFFAKFILHSTIFGVLLFFGGYKWQAYLLKKDLKTILQADIIEEER
jgi:hypothetical protein